MPSKASKAAATKTQGSNSLPSQQMNQQKPYQVVVSLRFIATTIVLFSALAFGAGQLAYSFISPPPQPVAEVSDVIARSPLQQIDDSNNLPPPLVKGEKTVPVTIFTSKHFDTAKPKSTASLFLRKDQMGSTKKQPMVGLPGGNLPAAMDSKRPVKTDEPPVDPATVVTSFIHDSIDNTTTVAIHGDDDEEHLPAGQHLLADIENVQMSFLDSKKRLADAMVELVYECGLTMLSYHCHGLTPSGVSCAGVLLESHVSFHTWPEAGVITLDLFTCGSTSLLPIVPMVEKLFALQREGSSEPPRMVWSYKRRGFAGFSSINNDNTDFFSYPVGIHGMGQKREIAAFETEQDKTRIRVYDVLHENYQDTMDRQVYINGRLKFQTSQQAAAQESMVHPAMLAHSGARRVALVGGSEGGTIREVLKHKSVEKVVLLEKEPEMVHLAKTQLADWNDCQELVGSAPSCFDDSRVQLFYAETQTWFAHTTEEAFDVIIVDEPTYDETVLQSLHKSLKDDGILVMHLCAIGDVSDSRRSQKRGMDIHEGLQNQAKEKLAAVGFADSRYYEEVHGGFVDAKGFVVAFKSKANLESWNRNEAQVDLELSRRAAATVSGQTPFNFFDGATMKSYQEASAWEMDASKMKRLEVPFQTNDGSATPASYTKQENNSDSADTDSENDCTNPMSVDYEATSES